MASSGQVDTEDPGVTGLTGVSVDVGSDLILEVFEKVEKILPEFLDYASAMSQLLQWLLHDFRMATTSLQTEQASIQTQLIALKELLQELGRKGGDTAIFHDDQDVVEAICAQFHTLRSEVE